ncbi:MAG: sortase [Anaerolineaceae bacterium]|nr:sortase [Anaerolineaceae bacterium]
MKSVSRVKQWLVLLLVVVTAAGVLVQAAGAADPTGRCTNLVNEGVEYISYITVMGSDVSLWRQNVNVYAKDNSGKIVGKVTGMDIEVTNDTSRFNCTINKIGIYGEKTEMSCNSIPVNAIINAVYFIYQPDFSTTPVDTPIRFYVDSIYGEKELHDTYAVVKLPPYPCARNIITRDFAAAAGKTLALYSTEGCSETTFTCPDEQTQTLKCNKAEKVCNSPYLCNLTGKSGQCEGSGAQCVIYTQSSPVDGKCTDGKICQSTMTADSACDTICLLPSIDTKSPEDGNCLEMKCYKNSDGTVAGDPVEKTGKLPISEQTLTFYEKSPRQNQYAIVNVMHDDYIVGNRVRINVTPEEEFDYKLTLTFGYNYDAKTDTYNNTADVVYSYDPKSTPKVNIDASQIDGLGNTDLPLVLLGGTISEVNKLGRLDKTWNGVIQFPTSVDFEVRFWYENDTGTLGYENSVFHFIRNLNFKIAPTCDYAAEGGSLYDPCQQSMQGFITKLNNKIEITGNVYGGTSAGSNWPVEKRTTENDLREFWFVTRKCLDASCEYVTSTDAYPANINMSDGGGMSRNYTNSGRVGIGTATRYWMRPYYYDNRPFAITGVTLAASEPGTYVIYPFVKYGGNDKTNVDPTMYYPYSASDKSKRIFVTVNETDELLTCSTLANNGYFKAWWNDCLSRSETQLISFEHIPGTEEAWIRNRSNHDVNFPFVPEYSYLPQKLEVASLNCKFEALEAGAATGKGWCHHAQIHVPAHTKVTITGGTMYMSGYPEYDEYRAAYMREDTYNISHLFFSIGVDECKTKKIPDTGLSLRSPMTPLKVNAKVEASPDEATGFVFTGNSLRIPAIGLGMETPIPIVHVYYEGDSADMEWDLSTLGNYVGELEGGTYLPYAGNSVLTGHYWSGGVFKNLEHLNYEDEIIIYGNDGFKYTYHVAQKFISEATDVYEMFQQIGDRSLTLVTCENYNLITNKYERRYIVRAIINSVEPYEEVW